MDRSTLDLKSFAIGWVVLLAAWLALSYAFQVPEFFLASPGSVRSYTRENSSALVGDVWLTGSQAAAGWGAAVILGIAFGSAIYQLAWVRRVVLPVMIAMQTTPIIALAPLVTFWFGYGWLSKAIVACFVATFPIAMASYAGLADARPTYIHIYRLAGASNATIFWQIRLRCAWSALMPALKTAVVMAVIGSVIAEFMGGNEGLGSLVMKAVYGTKSRVLLTSIILSALIGQLLLLALEMATTSFQRRIGKSL